MSAKVGKTRTTYTGKWDLFPMLLMNSQNIP